MEYNNKTEPKYYVCLPGWIRAGGFSTKTNHGGSGWEDGRIIESSSFDRYGTLEENPSDVIWPKGGDSGVYRAALREATGTEIEAYEKGIHYVKNIPIIENYQIY